MLGDGEVGASQPSRLVPAHGCAFDQQLLGLLAAAPRTATAGMSRLAAGRTKLAIVRALFAAALARRMLPAREEAARLREDGAAKEGGRFEVRHVPFGPFVLGVGIRFARTSAAARSIRWPLGATSCPVRHRAGHPLPYSRRGLARHGRGWSLRCPLVQG